MTQLIAICAITRRHPNHPDLDVTGYDGDGEPILRVRSEHIQPGDIFDEANGATVEELLQMEAARHLTDSERMMFERGDR